MISCLFQRNRIHFARLLSVVTAEGVSCNSKQPGPKQGAVAKLICFAIDDEHHFLSKFFAHGRLAAARAYSLKGAFPAPYGDDETLSRR